VISYKIKVGVFPLKNLKKGKKKNTLKTIKQNFNNGTKTPAPQILIGYISIATQASKMHKTALLESLIRGK